jgi:uncharacterized membrane protein/uncharacterized RDD family membrane protein YckC
MVAAATLLVDVAETSIFYAAPALLWLFVFLLAYRDPELAKRSGFDRKSFWLLIPGALLGEFANIPIFGYHGDLLAVNVGGGLIPVLLSVWLLRRVLPGGAPTTVLLLTLAGLQAFGALLAFLFVPYPLVFAVAFVALVVPLLVVALYGSRFAGPLREVWFAVLAIGALFAASVELTALTTATIPGLGIVSAFPEYLILPVGTGLLWAALLRDRIGGSYGPTLATTYAGVTLGVLVGADVLHQPPLYTGSSGALYAIGGAGLLDLLHLSGLLGLLGAYAVVAYLRRPGTSDRSTAPALASPGRRLRRAWYLGLEQRYAEALGEAQRATDDARASLRRLAGLPDAPAGTPWAGLAPPPWIPVDAANLDALAHRPTPPTGPETYRSWLTARGIVTVLHHLGAGYRASPRARWMAFGLDLTVLALAMASADLAVLAAVPGSAAAVLGGLPLNALVVGDVGWGLAYFLLAEGIFGTTLGKRYFGLAVRSRTGGAPGFRSVLVRNLPRVVPLSLLAYGFAFDLTVLTHSPGQELANAGFGSVLAFDLVFGAAVTAGLALCLLVSVATISVTEESQRLGDLLAETWVVTTPPVRPGAPTAPLAAVAPAAPAASPRA